MEGVKGCCSYWMDELCVEEARLAAWDSREDAVDVVVVGAGIAGVSVGFHLWKLGFGGKALIVDGRGIARGATGTNGGHLWPRGYNLFEQHCAHEVALCARELGVMTHLKGSVELVRSDDEMKAIPVGGPGEERWGTEELYDKIPNLKRGMFYAGVYEVRRRRRRRRKLAYSNLYF